MAGTRCLRSPARPAVAVLLIALAVSSCMGAGANARHSLGTGIIGGMIGASTLALLYVQLFFYLFDKLAEREKKEGETPAAAGLPGGGAPAATAPHAERRDD